jgi:hypothetical protein
MSDPIRNYLDSVANLEHVSANAKRMISVVLNVAAALQRNPLGVMFSNTVTGMPMSVGTERPIANASDWPTAEQIQQALAIGIMRDCKHHKHGVLYRQATGIA